MTDYYKISLEFLGQILKEEGQDFWANWMLEDIKLWETNKSVEHHLHAYGGMGSFNDIFIGNNDTEGLWKSRVFGSFQTLAYSLAKGNTFKLTLKESFSQSPNYVISGWRCRNCGDAKITSRDIEICVSSIFTPKLFVEFLQEDKLSTLLRVDEIITSEPVKQKRQAIESLARNMNINVASDSNWWWTCPKCASDETCAYRWVLVDGETRLIEADDNLEIKK
ncbi:MAG: hypothetical protein V4585_17530 [Bacteroidota bacterium]|jgi:hypothetical protein